MKTQVEVEVKAKQLKLRNFMKSLSCPIFKKEIHGVAQSPDIDACYVEDDGMVTVSVTKMTGYEKKAKPRRLDRWLDFVTRISGSETVFFIIFSVLLGWALAGVKFGQNLTWQAIMSDVQAILSYVFDSFLMRQQLNGYEDCLTSVAEMRSRITSHRRMFEIIADDMEKGKYLYVSDTVRSDGTEGTDSTESANDTNRIVAHDMNSSLDCLDGFEPQLPQETLFGRLATGLAYVIGHFISVIIFWIGIVIWLAFGHHCGWTSTWQLYINSATSALMVFIFAFLANIRERHAQYSSHCLNAIFQVDSALELKLRRLTNYHDDNLVIVVPPPKVNTLQKWILYYADVVGTLLGILILLVALVVWALIGPVMHFDSNWWLLIGTYAGLIGLNDGFVLRNVQNRLKQYEHREYDLVDSEDIQLFTSIGLGVPERETVESSTISHKVSFFMDVICGHELTVVAGVVLLVGLLAASSALKWSITGQLICNIPPSIIESFFMMILITGHNYGDQAKRVTLRNIYQRRLALIGYVTSLERAQAAVTN
jgi:low-affinity ferrous iron transport protein